MELLGYFAIILAGISVGLIGAGGSILTVPILVYLFAINPVLATAYSLFVVGVTSLVGVVPKYFSGNVSLKTALVFGFPSMISILLVRKLILPHLPEIIVEIDSFQVSKSMFLMLFFAVLMLFVARSTLKKRSYIHSKTSEINLFLISLLGFVEGSITGIVGAGGGFIIIPILMFFARINIKKAIGTSLLIIGIKSVIGFFGDVFSAHFEMNWWFLTKITLICIFGMFVGNGLSKKIDGNELKTGFGWFLFFMGIYIIVKEIFFY